MRGNCSTNQRPGKSENSVERDQKLFRSGDYHNECIHQVWYLSHERFVWKCPETKVWWTDGRTDRRTDGQDHSYSPPPQLRWRGTNIGHIFKLLWLFLIFELERRTKTLNVGNALGYLGNVTNFWWPFSWKSLPDMKITLVFKIFQYSI